MPASAAAPLNRPMLSNGPVDQPAGSDDRLPQRLQAMFVAPLALLIRPARGVSNETLAHAAMD
jgi:hypothetical protein